MGRVVGYVRVSSDKQTVKNQEHSILQYCNSHSMTLDETIEVSLSSRRTIKQRRIDELLEKLQAGDILIVSELSRLARSVGQIAIIIDTLLNNDVRVVCIKEKMDLNGERDIQAKTMITIISLFAELERDGEEIEIASEAYERAAGHAEAGAATNYLVLAAVTIQSIDLERAHALLTRALELDSADIPDTWRRQIVNNSPHAKRRSNVMTNVTNDVTNDGPSE